MNRRALLLSTTAALALMVALSPSFAQQQSLEERASKQRLDAINAELHHRLYGEPGSPPLWIQRGAKNAEEGDPVITRLLAERAAEEAKYPRPEVPPGMILWNGKITDPATLVPRDVPLSAVNPMPPQGGWLPGPPPQRGSQPRPPSALTQPHPSALSTKGMTSIERFRAVSDISRVHQRLRAVYTDEEARTWLSTPNPALNGERPLDLIKVGRADEVLALIDRLPPG